MSSDWMRWFTWLGVIAATAGAVARQPTFRSGVDLVTVDAAVLDGDGQPVPSLGAGDFRIEVDGRPRRIVSAQFVDQRESIDAPLRAAATHFSSNDGATDGRIIVVAVDEAHIRRLEGRPALAAASRFIDSLPAIDRIGVVGLTSSVGVTLTRDRLALRNRLGALIGNGDLLNGQFNLGISEALEIADGSRARLSDAVLRECGRSLTEYVSTARAADDAGGGRDSCPEQVEQESRGMAQHAHAQARISLAGLEALIVRLKDLPGPKTVVLLSEGMVVDPRRVDVSKLAADAQAARVTIYALALEVPEFDATQQRVAATATRDRQVRQDGVAQVAGAARGAVFRLVGDDPAPFARITRELSGHYLLAFESADSDRDGRAHGIRVTLARGGHAVRARTRFTVPLSTPPARGAQLSALLRTLSPANELPLRIATYTYAEPARRALRVVISAEAGRGEGAEGAWMGFVLVDAAGVIAATAAHDSLAGRHAFSTVVPEGRYVLRAAAIDAIGRQGSVERVFAARLDGTGEWRVGDLMLAPLPATPAAPLEPIVDRANGDSLVAYLEMQPARAADMPAVRVEIARGASDPPLVTAVAAVAPSTDNWVKAQAVVPIGGLPPGTYVARAEIRADGVAAGRVSRPFTIAGR
jgi:VWFA-related protein